MTKIGFIGLLHFYKEILPTHVAAILFQKLQFGYTKLPYCIRKKDWYINTKSNDKGYVLLFLHKNSELFYHLS